LQGNDFAVVAREATQAFKAGILVFQMCVVVLLYEGVIRSHVEVRLVDSSMPVWKVVAYFCGRFSDRRRWL
jgi:hypothetical protein